MKTFKNLQKPSKHFITILFSLLIFKISCLAQVNVSLGGIVKLGAPSNNQSNYVLVGTNTRMTDCKFTIDAFDKNGLGVYAYHNYSYGLATWSAVSNWGTKCNVVSQNGVHNFYVYGNGWSYARAYYTFSDRRFKTNIKQIQDPLLKIKALTGYYYNLDPQFTPASVLNRGGKTTADSNTYIGVIAQDLVKVLPECISYDEDSLMAVNYPSLVALLIEGIKELELRVDSLSIENNKVLKSIQSNNQNNPNKIGNEEFNGVQNQTGVLLEQQPKLYQNRPNPFKGDTYIKVYLPQQITNGKILITDLTGKLLKTLAVNGQGEIEIKLDADGLQPGIFLYTLILNGHEVNTLKMILTE